MNNKENKDLQLYFSNEMLHIYGCENCIWKEMGQCPFGYKDNETHKDGYCEKVLNFFMSLADSDDSVSAVKEKFHLFIQEIQSLQDRKEYMRLKLEYDTLKRDIDLDDDVQVKKLRDIEGRMNTHKIWWSRLSESLVKGLGKIADREKRANISIAPPLTIQQLNKVMKDSAKHLEGEFNHAEEETN